MNDGHRYAREAFANEKWPLAEPNSKRLVTAVMTLLFLRSPPFRRDQDFHCHIRDYRVDHRAPGHVHPLLMPAADYDRRRHRHVRKARRVLAAVMENQACRVASLREALPAERV